MRKAPIPREVGLYLRIRTAVEHLYNKFVLANLDIDDKTQAEVDKRMGPGEFIVLKHYNRWAKIFGFLILSVMSVAFIVLGLIGIFSGEAASKGYTTALMYWGAVILGIVGLIPTQAYLRWMLRNFLYPRKS